MRRILLSVVVLVFAAAMPFSGLSAQRKVVPYIGGGLASGTGDLGDATKSGWLGFLGFDCALGSTPGLTLGATASYTHIPYEGAYNDATNIPALFAELGYVIGASSASKVKPYVRGGVGVMQHRYDAGDLGSDFDESETKFGFGGGAGLDFMMGSTSLFAGAHYITAGSSTSYLAFYGGLGFPGKKSSGSQAIPRGR